MLSIREVLDTVKNFFAEKGKVFTFLVLSLAFLILVGFILLGIQCSTMARKINIEDLSGINSFSRLDEIRKPQTEELFEEYYYSRTSETWNKEETERFWTPIDNHSVDELGKVNDTIIQEITGAAP